MFYLVPESDTRQKLVPDCMTHIPQTVTNFLVLVSATGFWYVCQSYALTYTSNTWRVE